MNKVIPTIILGLSLLAAALLVLAPPLPIWGERHLPHSSDKNTSPLPIPPQWTVEQTFTLEHPLVDSVVIWLDQTQTNPQQGEILLTVSTADSNTTATHNLSRIPPSGVIFFNLNQPLDGSAGEPASIKLATGGTDKPVFLKYQIDATKFEEGALIYHANERKKGDLAFQVRYRRPALAFTGLQWTYALTLILAGFISIYGLSSKPRHQPLVQNKLAKKDIYYALILTIVIAAIYSFWLIRPGLWIGPSDFSKDVSYVTASSDAIRLSQWPAWTHLTCGGMSLLGNPESSTISIATLLALITRPELALWLTLALEAGLAGAGTYLLARALRLTTTSSLLAAVIAALSPVFAYKLVEGLAMTGGAFALTPWVLLGLVKSFTRPSPPWIVFTGLAITAIFWRGDVHIIVGVLTIALAWTLWETILQRSWRPLIPAAAIISISWLGASIKVLPYLEQTDLINTQVESNVALLTKQRLWDDIFLALPSRSVKVPVQRGLPEHYGYFGAYIGLIPLTLALLGLMSRHRYRFHLFLAAGLLLLLAEGTLYDSILRHLGPLRALLRMPSRLLIALIPIIGILAGLGWMTISQKSKPVIYRILGALLVVAVTIDLLAATHTVLTDNLWHRSSNLRPAPTQPILSPHLNASSFKDDQHASVLLASGYLLPKVCGDQNNPPAFISKLETNTPLSDHSVSLSPNVIDVQTPPASADIIIRERFSSSWIPSSGYTLANNDGSIHLITASEPVNSIRLQYISPTIRSQQALIALLIFLAIASVLKPLTRTWRAPLAIIGLSKWADTKDK